MDLKMTTEEIKNMVQLYFDSELEKGREPELFSLLSSDQDARDFFKQLNLLRASVNETFEELPFELEERIMYSIDTKEEKRRPGFFRTSFFPAFSYAVAVILLIVSIILFTEVREYKTEIDTISHQVKLQNQTIELILNNSLPPAEVEATTSNEIIIQANM